MGIKKFKVHFENANRCFFPGQLVSGHVTIDVKKRREIKGLWIKFEGKATVSWTERGIDAGSTSEKKGPRKVMYRDIEPYFNTEIALLGHTASSVSAENGPVVSIASGTSTYPFGFTLPLGIPSSYVGKAGQVYYSAEVSLIAGKSNLKQRFPFTVNGILDLNREAGVTAEMDTRKYKRLGCLCCRSGPVGFLFKLPKKGYVPGEPIPFVVEINNQSRKNVKATSISLVQFVSFHAKGNTFTDTRTIRKIYGPEVKKGQLEIWDRDALQIPPVPPTRLANCRIIDLRYTLKVEMEVYGFVAKIKGELPITIGTIPLRSTFPNIRLPQPPPRPPTPGSTTKSEQVFLTAPAERPTAPPFMETYPDLPPPSYEQAMSYDGNQSKGAVNVAFKAGRNDNTELDEAADLFRVDETFTPRYISYVWTG